MFYTSNGRKVADQYLQGQSKPVKAAFNRYWAVMGVSTFGIICLSVWIKYADLFGLLSRFIYIHPGDGTAFFLALSRQDIGFICGMLLAVVNIVIQKQLLSIAGEYKTNIQEYFNLLPRAAWIFNDSYRKWMKVAVLVFFLLLIPAVGSFTRITNQGIDISRFLGFGAKHYTWDDISKTESGYGNGSTGIKTNIFNVKVDFKDGTVWKTVSDTYRPASQVQDIAKYIEQHSRPVK